MATTNLAPLLLLLVSLLTLVQTGGQGPAGQALPAIGPSPTVENAPDQADLETFVDEYFGHNMAARQVPGAAIVFIQDGEILLARGYGYADREKQVAVDPARTLFRWASVSKLFPIAGILKLAEQGEIDLDANVNRYLQGWAVENAFADPLRVRHLLTHTDGFGTRDLATFALDAAEMAPLGELLSREKVATVQPPGQFITYGGYGTALAGHLIEQRSGHSFAAYARQAFFEPLGMHDSTFAQQLPAPLSGRVASVYTYEPESAQYLPAPFLHVNTPPTGGLTATPLDLARFIAALQKGGEYGGRRILSTTAVAAMLARQFTPHPGLPGVTYGFMEQFAHGQRGLVRDGSGVGIRSQVFLLPAHNLAYIYVQNSRGDTMVEGFNEAFLERYFSGQDPANTPAPVDSLEAYTGVYRPVQTNEYTLVKLEALLIGELAVTANGDGTLTITPRGQGDVYGGFDSARRYHPVAPNLFRREDQERYVAFAVDEQGQATHLFSGAGYHGSYNRIRGYESTIAQLIWLGASVLALCSGLIIWLPGLPPHGARPDGVARAARWTAVTATALLLLGLGGVCYGLFLKRIAGFPAFAFGISPLTAVMLGVLQAGAVAGVCLLPWTILIWHRRAWRGWARAHYTLLAAASVALIWWLHYWNLLGFRY